MSSKFTSKLKGAIRSVTKVQAWPATIVSAGTRPATSLVEFPNGVQVEVLNMRFSSMADLKVRVGYDPLLPDVLQVLGIRENLNLVIGSNSWNFWLIDHHENHEFPGHDTVWVQGAQFVPFNVVPTTGLNVRVYGSVFRAPSAWVGFTYVDVDLTSNVPASGARYVLLEVDSAGAVQVTDGSDKDSKSLLVFTDIPAPTAGRKPLAAVRLYDNQTEIVKDVRVGKPNDIVDLRWSAFATSGGDYDLAADIHAQTTKGTPDNNDEFALVDSGASYVLKKLTWANLKATLKTYFDTLYAALADAYSDEKAQDAVGGMLDDGTVGDIDFTYDDATPKISGVIKAGVVIPVNGWEERSETWTRTGNHTFTVATDLTTTFRKGTKVRYKDGGSFEYGVVASSSYSAPNTTVTLITNTDYAMAAAALTETAISYIENPEGYPDWFSYTPAPSASGSMTTSNETFVYSKFRASGRKIEVQVCAELDLGGTAHQTIYLTLPVEAISYYLPGIPFVCGIRDASTGIVIVGTGALYTNGSGIGSFYFRKVDGANWTTGVDRRVAGWTVYEY